MITITDRAGVAPSVNMALAIGGAFWLAIQAWRGLKWMLRRD